MNSSSWCYALDFWFHLCTFYIISHEHMSSLHRPHCRLTWKTSQCIVFNWKLNRFCAGFNSWFEFWVHLIWVWLDYYYYCCLNVISTCHIWIVWWCSFFLDAEQPIVTISILTAIKLPSFSNDMYIFFVYIESATVANKKMVKVAIKVNKFVSLSLHFGLVAGYCRITLWMLNIEHWTVIAGTIECIQMAYYIYTQNIAIVVLANYKQKYKQRTLGNVSHSRLLLSNIERTSMRNKYKCAMRSCILNSFRFESLIIR